MAGKKAPAAPFYEKNLPVLCKSRDPPGLKRATFLFHRKAFSDGVPTF
jgi:hypothetical protein